MKQKIHEILTSPIIQTNSVILKNCIVLYDCIVLVSTQADESARSFTIEAAKLAGLDKIIQTNPDYLKVSLLILAELSKLSFSS